MIPKTLVLLAFPLLLAGCSSFGLGASSGHPTASPTSLQLYHDQKYNFSFRYPSSWNVAKHGRYQSISGVNTYILDINPPSKMENAQVTVDTQLADYSHIRDGQVVPDPHGGPDTFLYHRLYVASWPALQIERYNGKIPDSIETIVNTRQYSYDVRVLTASPPFKRGTLSGYRTLYKTLKLPF